MYRWLMFALALGTCSVRADTLLTTDGSKLLGTVESIAGGKIVLATSYAGKLQIAQDAVRSIVTERRSNVKLRDGSVVAGARLHTAEDTVHITGDAGSAAASIADVYLLWPAAEQDPDIVALQRNWAFTASADMNVARGNSDQTSTDIGFEAVLAGATDTLRFALQFNRDAQNGNKTEDERIARVSYENTITGRYSWFVATELERDEFENLQLRSVTTAGFGYSFWNAADSALQVRGGLGYRFQNFNDATNDSSVTFDLGLSHRYRYRNIGVLTNELRYAPAVDVFGNYRMVQDSALQMPLGLSGFWKLRVGLQNEYNSRPVSGFDKLDTTYYVRLLLTTE